MNALAVTDQLINQFWQANETLKQLSKEIGATDVEFMKFTDAAYSRKYQQLTTASLAAGNRIWRFLDLISRNASQLNRHPALAFEETEEILSDYDQVVDTCDHVFEKIVNI